jgi:hypothetical protein
MRITLSKVSTMIFSVSWRRRSTCRRQETAQGTREGGRYNHNKGADGKINETIFFAFLSTPEKGALLTLH